MLGPLRLWNHAILPLSLLVVPASFMSLATPRTTSAYTMAWAQQDNMNGNNKNHNNGANENTSNCQSHGCPLFPLDVIASDEARMGIDILRKRKGTAEDYARIMESVKSAGDEDKMVLTLMGFKGGTLADQVNQDAATIISPFHSGLGGVESQLLGVFDGHANLGEVTSNHAAKEIPRLLATKLRTQSPQQSWGSIKDEIVIQAIKQSFIEADQTEPTFGEGGSTATMILQLGHKLYIANAGDSRSFIGTYVNGEVKVAYASREDKPELPDEQERIVNAGGYVHIPEASSGDVPRAYYIDPQGRPRFGLAMSRTIGDWKVQGVTAEPIVDVLNIATLVQETITNHTETCATEASQRLRKFTYYEEKIEDYCPPIDPSEVQIFAISASDGMLDYLEPEVIAKEIASSFFGREGKHPFVVGEHLIISSAEGWDTESRGSYRDDISISACKIIVNEQILYDGKMDTGSHDEL